MFMVQVNDKYGVLKEITHFGTDRAVAEQHFLSACEQSISNWNEYSPGDVETICDEGYAEFGGGAVNFIDTDGYTSDDAIGAMVGKYPAKEVQKITRWVQDGEIGSVGTIDEVLEEAGRCLDAACSWDICGQVLFQAEDGKFYVGTVELVIAEANLDFLEDALAEEGN